MLLWAWALGLSAIEFSGRPQLPSQHLLLFNCMVQFRATFVHALYLFHLWCHVSLEFWVLRHDISTYLDSPRSYPEPSSPFSLFFLLVSFSKPNFGSRHRGTVCMCGAHMCTQHRAPHFGSSAVVGTGVVGLVAVPFCREVNASFLLRFLSFSV